MVFETHDPLKGEMVCLLEPDGTYTWPDSPPLDDEQVEQFVQDWFTAAYNKLLGPGDTAASRSSKAAASTAPERDFRRSRMA